MKRCLFIVCCLALAGCAGKKPAQDPTSPADFVAVTLGDAAQTAHGELAMLAKLRGQGLQPLLPPADPTLNQPVSISWTGPAEGALKEICLQLGKQNFNPSESIYVLKALIYNSFFKLCVQVNPVG